jgi:hypothetical protein
MSILVLSLCVDANGTTQLRKLKNYLFIYLLGKKTQLLHKVEHVFKLKKNSATNYIMKKNSGNQLHNAGGKKIYYVLGHKEHQ